MNEDSLTERGAPMYLEMLYQARVQELGVRAEMAEHRATWYKFRAIDRLEAALGRAKSRLLDLGPSAPPHVERPRLWLS